MGKQSVKGQILCPGCQVVEGPLHPVSVAGVALPGLPPGMASKGRLLPPEGEQRPHG